MILVRPRIKTKYQKEKLRQLVQESDSENSFLRQSSPALSLSSHRGMCFNVVFRLRSDGWVNYKRFSAPVIMLTFTIPFAFSVDSPRTLKSRCDKSPRRTLFAGCRMKKLLAKVKTSKTIALRRCRKAIFFHYHSGNNCAKLDYSKISSFELLLPSSIYSSSSHNYRCDVGFLIPQQIQNLLFAWSNNCRFTVFASLFFLLSISKMTE